MVIWQHIETVLLDMDGTLLDLHFDNYFWRNHLPRHFAKVNNLSLHNSEALLFERFSQTQGTLDWYCLDYWSDELSIDIAALKTEVQHLIQYRPNAEEFLKKLNQCGKQTILVTNAHPKSLALKLNNTNLENYLDKIYSSHQFMLPKEKPLFWKNFQQQFPFNPDKTILFDDSHAVLHSAKSFGIKQLRAIEKPDSKLERTRQTEFIAVDDFQNLGL